MNRSLASRWWFWAGITLVAGLACLPYIKQFQGDAFIHYQYAKNLAQGMFMQFNPGEASGGTTAPLWTGLLALGYFLTGKEFLDAFAKLLGFVFAIGTAWMSFRLLKEFYPTDKQDALLPLLLVLDPYFSFWTVSGMEATAAAFGLLLALYFYLKNRNWLTGLSLAAVIMLRPEMILVLLLLVVLRPKAAFKLGFPAFFFVGIYYAAIYASTLTPFPASWATRRIHALDMDYTLNLGWFGVSALVLDYFAAAHAPLALFALFAFKGRWRLIWMILILIGIFFSTVVPTAYGMRYVLPVFPLLVILAWIGAKRVGLKPWILLVLMIPFWIFAGIKKLHNIRDTYRGYKNYQVIGQWLKQNTRPDALIAATEVQIAWFADRRVLSMDGVTDGKVIPFIKANSDLSDFLKLYKPDYLLGIPNVSQHRFWRRSIMRTVMEQSMVDILMGNEPNFVVEGIGFHLIYPAVFKLDYQQENPEQ